MIARNLVILSLDGVSQTLFWQYREVMPTLWNLSLRSAMFRRFYTSSTDSAASFCDFAHGNSIGMDHNASPSGRTDGKFVAGQETDLFSEFHRRGFSVRGIRRFSPGFAERSQRLSVGDVWPEGCGEFTQCGGHDKFCGGIDAFIRESRDAGKPFVLYCSDCAARPDDASPPKTTESLLHERFEAGFASLDRSVKYVVDALVRHGVLDDTLILAFGPYGMDAWRHGLFHGRTMDISPYADTCWTPMFLHGAKVGAGTADMLTSGIDLKPTLMHMFFPDVPEEAAPEDVFRGVDIQRHTRLFTLSQNMFALERESETPGKTKSYAIANGDMRLMVTSDRGVAGEGGMELYFDPRDPGNTRNLLDFFKIDGTGRMTEFGRGDIVHVHFTQTFKKPIILDMVRVYNSMREKLYCLVRRKEELAREFSGSDAGGGFPDIVFTVKKRWR